MKIAFDGTVLYGRKSGVGYYCEELLKAMLSMNHADQFYVFSHQPVDLDIAASNGNLKFTNSFHFPVRAFYLHALLPRILDKVQPDLCHYTNFLAPITEDRPYVVTIHDMGLEVLRYAHPLAKRLYTKPLVPRVARKAKLILTNSEYSKWEIVRHLGISEEQIRVTPLAASPEFMPVPVRPANPYFLYVGNLEPRKNLERLIEAFARMPGKSHELVIVGNRWYRGAAIEKKARALGANGAVKFLGYVPRAELPELFSGATAFVYPSLLEGFGLPIVEAMACGAPVITSNSSSLKEVAGGAALLVDPSSVRELTEAMARVVQDSGLREELSRKGLRRAAEFSWARTAELTLEAYREVMERGLKPATTFRTKSAAPGSDELTNAIRKTIAYAKLFQYPLTNDELRERLFDVEVDETTFKEALKSLQLQPDKDLFELRADRERISDEAIQNAQPQLRTLASIPFVRMIAFSGSTAHRNMTTGEDLDLFMVVEDGKLWGVFLLATVWAKLKGLRELLCMNYLISDAALPLFEHDAFTAQQVASLKPFFGKAVYDRFTEMNPFVWRHFPNFDPALHRERYREIPVSRVKALLESALRWGPAQLLERFSRMLLGSYLRRKAGQAAKSGDCDVLLEPRRLKLHMISHKRAILEQVYKP
ncbi:MAG TPA: glycosyltransferase family 1 protein [Terriglobia bacterium]|nr:glycosyltransferase family 1 protein [Terriglobia bacterium]